MLVYISLDLAILKMIVVAEMDLAQQSLVRHFVARQLALFGKFLRVIRRTSMSPHGSVATGASDESMVLNFTIMVHRMMKLAVVDITNE